MKKLPTLDASAASLRKSVRTTIGFRLEDEIYAKLSRRAGGLGVSAHELARHYVVEALLESEERMELRKAVNALAEHTGEARKDNERATDALLLSARAASETQAPQ